MTGKRIEGRRIADREMEGENPKRETVRKKAGVSLLPTP